MSPTRLPLLLALGAVLTATACSGSSAPSAGPADRPSGGPTPAHSGPRATPIKPSHPAHPGAGGTAAPAATDASGGSAAPDAQASDGSGGQPGQPDGSGSGSGSGQPAPLTPSGHYTYQLSGQASSALGTQKIDGTSSVVVDQPAGDRQHSTESNDQGSGDQTVVAKPAGLYLADVSMDQDGFHVEFRAKNPVLVLPANATPGQHWRWTLHSTDGKYTLDTAIKVTAVDGSADTPDGKQPTVSLASVIHLTGKNVDMTIHRTDEATIQGLIVNQRAKTEGTAYGTHFTSDVTKRLRVS